MKMTQAPYQPAPYQQGYQPQQQGYQPAPQGQPSYQQQVPQGQPYQPQQNGQVPPPYQQSQPQQQVPYQPVGQTGPVQGDPQAQPERTPMQEFQPNEDGSDPMLEDFTVFRGVAPYLTISDEQGTGYERGGTILAVGTDYARKFRSTETEYWTYGPKDKQPRMCRVLIVQTNERIPGRQDDTGIRTLELKDGTDAFRAAALAVRLAGKNAFEPGGQIFMVRTGTRPTKSGNDATTYTARYVPPPADYATSDAGMMARNTPEQAPPSNGTQQLQQAAAYVANTPEQPQGQPAWMSQGPQQQVPAAQNIQQQPPPWMQQTPAPQQAPPPWMNQQPAQRGYQPGARAGATPQHPFGPAPNAPVQNPYQQPQQ
jgi:hypothetical protein